MASPIPHRFYTCKLCYYAIIALFIIIMSVDYVHDVPASLIRRALYPPPVIITPVLHVLINCFMHKGPNKYYFEFLRQYITPVPMI